MTVWTTFVVALGLSADAFAAALSRGLHMRRFSVAIAFVISLTFGLFQAGMPLIGWAIGTRLEQYVAGVDHWVAFGLLTVIGLRTIWHAFADGDDVPDYERVQLTALLLVALATSIDAFAVGISLAFLPVSILEACAIIGFTTFALSLIGVFVGHRAGLTYRKPAEIAGGVILILIGTHILLSHLGYI